MTEQRVVLVSCPIRGTTYSLERIADIQFARTKFEEERRKGLLEGFVAIIPYLMFASFVNDVDDIEALREGCVGWGHFWPTEIRHFGPVDEIMRIEAYRIQMPRLRLQAAE